jgi:hypothetical protein
MTTTNDLIRRAIELHAANPNGSWQELDQIWQQVKSGYPRVSFEQSIGDWTGPGWWPLLAEAFSEVSEVMAHHPSSAFSVTQIKEKFGGLRFYWCLRRGDNDEAPDGLEAQLDRIIEKAEVTSTRTCEVCGEPGEVRRLSWLKTLCDVHYAEKKARAR